MQAETSCKVWRAEILSGVDTMCANGEDSLPETVPATEEELIDMYGPKVLTQRSQDDAPNDGAKVITINDSPGMQSQALFQDARSINLDSSHVVGGGGVKRKRWRRKSSVWDVAGIPPASSRREPFPGNSKLGINREEGYHNTNCLEV